MRFQIKNLPTNETITIVIDPKARLISKPQYLPSAMRELLDELGITDQTGGELKSDGASLSEAAGRLCYLSFGKPRPGGINAYVDNILSSGHGSVVEHPNYSFLISGVSRSLTHEFVRHRAGWSYSQLSQRYVDDEHLAFVVPFRLQQAVLEALLRGRFVCTSPGGQEYLVRRLPCTTAPDSDVKAGEIWLAGRFEDLREYRYTVDFIAASVPDTVTEKTERRKIARQTARNCLPNSTETMLIGTANARAIRHFISMRGSRHADEEIRMLTKRLSDHMRDQVPELFPDLTFNTDVYPAEVGLKYPKV